jgi:plasmid stability protein
MPDNVAKSLKKRAAEQGVSAEEEHHRIPQTVLASAGVVTVDKFTLFEHIRELGKIAPDFEFGTDRNVQPPRRDQGLFGN